MLGIALVAQIAVVASAPASAVTCAPFEISVAARAPGSVAPRIVLPISRGVEVLDRRALSRVDQLGTGESSALTEATFVVAVRAAGRVALPAFVATAGSQRGVGAPSPIELRPVDDAQPRVLVRARLDPERDSVFVGQQLDYVVDVQLNAVARDRLRRNPTFFPPEMPGVLAYDQALPPPPRRAGPHCFESLTYRRALFPLFAGTAVIPPASLSYSLPVSTSFFSREETFSLRTDSVRFHAVDPPAAGRPAGYIGAVGQVSASARLATARARMGDPVILTLRLEAVGNVKLMPRPVITLPWASIALGEERVTVDPTASQVRGTKEFDWLLTPRHAGVQGVPAIRYPYFDPSLAEYDVAVTDSLRLDVAAASMAVSDSVPPTRLAVRIRLRDERGPPLPARPWFWALFALAPAPAAIRHLRLRRRRVRRRSALARLQALAGARTASVGDVRRALRAVLVGRVPALAAPVADASLARTLRRAGVTDATAERAASLLAELDAAAFAAGRTAPSDLLSRALSVARAVDAEAVRAPGPSRSPTMLVVAAIALGTLGAATVVAMPDPLRRSFSEGVEAYGAGDFDNAERLFARVSARVPRAADAWANLGTAAWARGDSAMAAVGWQRALRLDPLDGEMRERLGGIQNSSLGEPAYVPPLPADALATVAVALWLGAWAALALSASRRHSSARPIAGGALVLALLLLGVALDLQRRSLAGGLVVIRGAHPLLPSPTAGAEPLATATTGEVGALGAREGAWVRITIDGDRAGWLPMASVLPLDDPLH